MEKQLDFSKSDPTQLDNTIQKTLNATFPLPPIAAKAQDEAFEKIRSMANKKNEGFEKVPSTASERGIKEEQSNLAVPANRKRCHPRQKKALSRFVAGAGAVAAASICILIANPTAAQMPIVKHVFETLGETLGFAGDYTDLADPVNQSNTGGETKSGAKTGEEAKAGEKTGEEAKAGANTGEETKTGAETITADGTTITLSEAYCNEAALYLALVVRSKDQLPETLLDQNGKPVIKANGLVDFDFDKEAAIDLAMSGNADLDGEMLDAHTYAGVIRFDMGQYYADTDIEIPENFHAKLSLSQLLGTKLEDNSPEMPQELKEKYNAAMKENNLGLTEADYEQFTEEQKEIEHRLFSDMWNAYYEMYPEAQQYPNKYRDWWIDGSWEFEFDITRKSEGVIRKDINDLDGNGLGLIAVTKTPVEITVEMEENVDYFMLILDADGNLMDEGDGYPNAVAVSGHDTSKIDVYICDYMEYMDELKGYWWSEDYEEKAKQKTFKQLLDERALYHREVVF